MRILFGFSLALLMLSPAGARTKSVAPDSAEVITLTLDAQNFRVIDLYRNGGEIGPISWQGCKIENVAMRLKSQKPAAILREPQYTGKSRLYGYLTLGIKKDRVFNFALDVTAPDDMVMFFDKNQNGDLADDGSPLPKKGSFKKGKPGFATMIELPWETLGYTGGFQEPFKIWFFINEIQWDVIGFSHASRSQLKGMVKLNGEDVPIILADSAANDNDADLTNDGVHLVLEPRVGKVPQKLLSVKDAEARSGVEFRGKRYLFRFVTPGRESDGQK